MDYSTALQKRKWNVCSDGRIKEKCGKCGKCGKIVDIIFAVKLWRVNAGCLASYANKLCK